LACCTLSWSFPHRLLAVWGTALRRGNGMFPGMRPQRGDFTARRTNVALVRPG
jgi:hypothetical protein